MWSSYFANRSNRYARCGPPPINPEPRMPTRMAAQRPVLFSNSSGYRAPYKRDHLLLVCRRTVGSAHPHAAEPDGRNLLVAVSKFALLHRGVLQTRIAPNVGAADEAAEFQLASRGEVSSARASGRCLFRWADWFSLRHSLLRPGDDATLHHPTPMRVRGGNAGDPPESDAGGRRLSPRHIVARQREGTGTHQLWNRGHPVPATASEKGE
jgi:hypothetical protein